MAKEMSEREIVLAVLMEVTEHGQYCHIVLRDTLSKYQYLEKRQRAFITRLTEGTLEHLIEIDYILNWFSKVKVRKMKPVIRNVLRMGVYQIKYMDSVPDHAACSESVRLAAKKGFSGLKGYVNGVLRSIARELDTVRYPEGEKERLSVIYSCPLWILDMWSSVYDPDVIETMLKDFQKEKPLTVRCCLDRTTPEKLMELLEKDGVHSERHPYLPYALEISGFDYLEDVEAFRKGLFAVQDISSMLVGELAAPKAGDMVLDLCAAPGGKTMHLAEQLERAGSGSVEARDLSEYKVDLIRENIERAGLKNVTVRCRDASVPDETMKEKADIVIADLPCSGLGVIGKKADLKYNASAEGIQSLIGLQRKILDCARDYVRPGGTLLYSTCTVSEGENSGNVEWFLKKYPEFTVADIRDRLCPELSECVAENGCLQLLPGVQKSDGFFIAKLIKRKG